MWPEDEPMDWGPLVIVVVGLATLVWLGYSAAVWVRRRRERRRGSA